jgi:hypothetical protein
MRWSATAWSARKREGHVAAENALVEIVDEQGRDVAPGGRGRVIVTGLNNYAMPFIRYQLGDIALAGTAPCGCGRALPVITRVEGRTRNASARTLSGPPCFLVAKILKTESDHFDRFEVGFGLVRHPNPNFAKNGHRRGIAGGRSCRTGVPSNTTGYLAPPTAPRPRVCSSAARRCRYLSQAATRPASTRNHHLERAVIPSQNLDTIVGRGDV